MATLTDAKRLVVKIGSALLVDRETGQLKSDWLRSLAEDVAMLRDNGTEVTLVSSGSIALGRRVLHLPEGELPVEQSQAAAAVGAIRLARAYEDVFTPHGKITAQVLVTLDDSTSRRRYLNSRATLDTLLSLGAIPIVNENDTIATDEIRYGDNDRLAAQVAVTVGADQLILLSDVDGFYNGNPHVDPSAKRFEVVEEITPEIQAMAGLGVSGLSKGGMITKLLAAKVASEAGCDMAITLGSPLNPLKQLMDGCNSTWFKAQTDPHSARKNWISAMKPKGEIRIDEGAARALAEGNSLLPAGVVGVSGRFGRGDPVAISGPDGARVGFGLTRYTAEETRKLRGHQSDEIEKVLGYKGRASLVHRDDMVV
ncbi:glutamate 5-kinase [Limimaricola litoreus]|uniref:Glutamate 5-kinase n=1 Tax=Limimaricola litoreus TaxID=2955316 RepID=A0A9X2FQK6_9RHOB|nr:glutamate 5-kinase [Limimaricola litoreus]MCP1169397.1 glutamate 5-kinase [Limimaricola litoreus]